MKIRASNRSRGILRFVAIVVPIMLVVGMVLEVISKIIFPPHHIAWHGVAIEAVTTLFWIALIVGFSALLPPTPNRNP